MSLDQQSTASPKFDFIEYFSGHQRVSGWFSDRFGNVKRHFCGDFVGAVNDDGVFVLDEALYYNDGMVETRVWNVTIDENGQFKAESDSLIGPALGVIKGNALNMQYVMKVEVEPSKVWNLSMNDYMFLQNDGSLHNITHVYKFGIRIGTVSTQYFRPDANRQASAEGKTCAPEKNADSELATVVSIVR